MREETESKSNSEDDIEIVNINKDDNIIQPDVEDVCVNVTQMNVEFIEGRIQKIFQ